MRNVLLVVVVLLGLTCCTKSEATKIADASGQVCTELVLLSPDPLLAPLCVTAQEIADAAIQLTGLPAARSSEAIRAVNVDQLRARVLANRGAEKKATK